MYFASKILKKQSSVLSFSLITALLDWVAYILTVSVSNDLVAILVLFPEGIALASDDLAFRLPRIFFDTATIDEERLEAALERYAMFKYNRLMFRFELALVERFDRLCILAYILPLHKLLSNVYLLVLLQTRNPLLFLFILCILQNTGVFNGHPLLCLTLSLFGLLPDDFAVLLRMHDRLGVLPSDFIRHHLVIIDYVA